MRDGHVAVVTQRPAKPCTPVRFRAWPPDFISLTVFHLGECGKLCYIGSLDRVFLGSSVVEQLAVNQLVAGSNPARGATLSLPHFHLILLIYANRRKL